MVFQNYALYPHMTVYDNMAFALKLRKTPKAEIDEAVKQAAQMLQLEDYLDRKPKALSGGQRQRVAMGRAIVREPQVFLMDEPLSNLDAKLRVQTRSQIATLQAQLGITTVYVTHDQVEAMTMGHRVAVLLDGMLQQVDTPRALYDKPANVFVAGFIGSPAMNIKTVAARRRRRPVRRHHAAARPASRSRGRAPTAATARSRSASARRTATWSATARAASRSPSTWSRSWAPTRTSTRSAAGEGSEQTERIVVRTGGRRRRDLGRHGLRPAAGRLAPRVPRRVRRAPLVTTPIATTGGERQARPPDRL